MKDKDIKFEKWEKINHYFCMLYPKPWLDVIPDWSYFTGWNFIIVNSHIEVLFLKNNIIIIRNVHKIYRTNLS